MDNLNNSRQTISHPIVHIGCIIKSSSSHTASMNANTTQTLIAYILMSFIDVILNCIV